MILNKVASEVIDKCINEINKNENIELVKDKLLKPCFIHIYNYFHKYIILFYFGFTFLWISMIILLFVMIKVLNKLAILEGIKVSSQ
jgi:hypothetical protein